MLSPGVEPSSLTDYLRVATIHDLMREHFKHWHSIAVRWGDMDALGHVNNAMYFTYCESARMSYFEAIELWKYREHDRQGPALVTATCRFKQQVHYPAWLDVGARVSEIGNRSFTLEYEIYRQGTDVLVADGSSVVAWVDYEAGKAIPLPDGLRAAIRRFEGLRGEGET
ncbi:MAG: acyl-CoA thioesterase [Acidobacteria bacterium]|nr:MAG: acyl-CoA thioesterase [Acidobacteriota bacterium]